ncbi:hypothetical protein BHE74_00009137 [Ensete ventricosum]|nr:hypothetical protein GW17_00010373 [Ensete ventricosum]RWW82396.1 hypothetical protein BHE74_00009137 [Ensete ventricosum]RZR80841.1 hypothetical protein BHM03_00006921 [Ensete ventricosum]
MNLMCGLPKVGRGHPGSASSVPANTSVPEQPSEPTSPLDVQEIPPEEATRGTPIERTRRTPKVPSKRPAEELIDQRKKSKSEILREEIQRLKDGCNLDAIVSAKQWASEAQVLADNLKIKLEEATQERETLEKELCGV